MNNSFIRNSVMAAVLLAGLQGSAQQVPDEDLIRASQGAASAMIFSTDVHSELVKPGKFYDEKECVVRKGLPHILGLLQSGKAAKIVYIGGSITQGDYCYRQQSAKFIASRYPKSKLTFQNAGVSGTGTDLGACRIGEQVLSKNPDLIFIEFAVNGAYAPGMEGMVRQIIKNNPFTDICFIYTIMTGQTDKYAQGSIPDNIQRLEAVADHYGLTSVHLGIEASLLEKDNKLLWKGTKEEAAGRILFSNDGIHPLRNGGDLYAAAIARAFIKMEQRKLPLLKKQLTDPLFADNWEDAYMYAPGDIAQFNGAWEKMDPEKGSSFYHYRPWFPYIMKSATPGASFTFNFEGSAFGIFDIGGPEVGQLQIEVDGKRVYLKDKNLRGTHIMTTSASVGDSLINRFNVFCNNRYRVQYQLIELEQGLHNISIIVSPEKADKEKILGIKNLSDIIENPHKYERSEFYFGKLLLRGDVVR